MDQSKKTKMLDISKIKLNPNNPRTIKDDKFKKLCKSLKANPEFLDARPIVVKDGVIYGGNMRWLALKETGMDIKPEWIKDVSGWTDEAIRKFVIVDNLPYGEDDWDKIANEYEKEELEDWGMDVDKWGDMYGEDFTLPDGDKAPFQQMTFTLADQQAELIKEAINQAKNINLETYDNENGNGNALYWIVKQWIELKK